MNDKKVINDQAAVITRLSAKNCTFTTKNGFLCACLQQDEAKNYDRVFVHRAFPFDMLTKYISVLDDEQNEIGLIFDLEDFDKKQKELILSELDKKYYQPKIKEICSLKERYGFSYWNVTTKDGREVNFTMKDTFRNIIRVGLDRAILLDVDGNRFEIESIEELDRKSHRKIELYL